MLPPPPKIPVKGSVEDPDGEVQVGGEAHGFDGGNWPHTPDGAPMTFLARIPMDGLSARFKSAYVFMAQTYDPETSECINETFDPELGLTKVVLQTEDTQEAPAAITLAGEKRYRLVDSWMYDYDTDDDSPDEWTPLLDDEPLVGDVRVGGRVRWWQGGYYHPVDSNGEKMRLIAQFEDEAHPELTNFIADGVCHIFWSEATGETGLAWEID